MPVAQDQKDRSYLGNWPAGRAIVPSSADRTPTSDVDLGLYTVRWRGHTQLHASAIGHRLV